MKTYVSPMPSKDHAQTAIRGWASRTEQKHYEESLNSMYDAYLHAEDWDNALFYVALMENHIIPIYGENSCEYATVLFKKGVLFKRGATSEEDKIEAAWLLIESKKRYEQLGLKNSECWKSCMKEIGELIGN